MRICQGYTPVRRCSNWIDQNLLGSVYLKFPKLECTTSTITIFYLDMPEQINCSFQIQTRYCTSSTQKMSTPGKNILGGPKCFLYVSDIQLWYMPVIILIYVFTLHLLNSFMACFRFTSYLIDFSCIMYEKNPIIAH